MTPDEQLHLYATQRSQDAFSAVVNEYGPMVYQVARRQVKDAHLAEDITQAVFVLLARRADKIGSGRMPGWLMKTAYFMSRDALKRNWTRQKHERQAAATAPDALPDPNPEVQEFQPALDGALARLKQPDRDVLTMRYLMGRSLSDIAISTSSSEEAVRKRAERALLKLRKHLGKTVLSSEALPVALAAGRHVMPADTALRVARSVLGGPDAVSARAAELVRIAIGRIMLARLKFAVTLLAVAAFLGAGIWWAFNTPVRPLAQTTPAQPHAGVKVVGTGWYPVAPGWPVAVSGSVTSTPGLVDLDGDGKPEIIVTSMARHADPGYAHPRPTSAALVYAFHGDGKPVPGFPVEILDAPTHQRLGKDDLYTEAWFSSPSAIPGTTADKRQRIALISPFGRGLCIIDGDAKITRYPGGNQWNPCPLADLGHDGIPDIVMGNLLNNVDGGPVSGWPATRKWKGKGIDGFAPCIGDARGDGALECYLLRYGAEVAGYDQNGQLLPGWPRKVDDPSWFAPVMGNILKSDKTKQVVAAYGDKIYAWTWDGKPVPAADADGVLLSGVDAACSSPTLADLDGDGVADIIVYDQKMHAIRAWHGNGKPVGDRPDGSLCHLQMPLDLDKTHPLFGAPWAGVSVANLGDHGIVDLFCGVFWARFDPATHQVIRRDKMVPVPMEMNLNQPVIADLRADGKAQIIMGLRDGRIIVYETGMPYHANQIQWATCNGGPQHAGVWPNP